jgi:hypothetical protein
MKKNRIVLISTYCDTSEKIEILKGNIEIIKSNGLDVMVNSPISLPNEIIHMCDFYIQTKENPLLYWPEKAVSSWMKHTFEDREIVINRALIDYGWAAIYQTKKLSEYALTYEYERYYHIVYDTLIDNTVISTFMSDKKCSFFPFHEHKVSLHLIALDRENLSKFLNYITYESYMGLTAIAEKWLYQTLINSDLEFTIESDKVDDLILFHKDQKLFDYSDINGITFFITKDVVDNKDICLYFYNNEEPLNVLVTIDGVESTYLIFNKDIINLGFKSDNIKNVVISYNGFVSDITKKIEDIIHNVINVKLL